MIRKINLAKSADPRRHRAPWCVDYRTTDGKRHRSYFTTKGQAQEHSKLVNARLNSDQFQTVTPLSWADLVTEFISSKKADQIADTTLKIYREIFLEFAGVCQNPLSTRITPQRIDIYKRHIAGNAAPTRNKKLRHLSALFNWAKKRHYMASNPIEVSGRFRETKKKPRTITPEQFQQLIDHCHDEQWKVLIHLAVNGVARKHSIAVLTIADIDFSAGTIRAFDRKQNEYRETPLHPESLRVLVNYVNGLPEGQVKLFTCRFHNTHWQRLLEKAKVPHITFHGLRTCMSSWLKNEGVSGDVVSKIFGHSTPTLTYRTYTALDDVESKRKALNRLPLRPPSDSQSTS